MKRTTTLLLVMMGLNAIAQQEANIVTIIDDLRYRWDAEAISLKNYQGIQEFCLTEDYRQKTIELLDAIHHWDTSLYFIVKNKYDQSQDREAAATLEDIEKLESEYSTENFKHYITNECGELKIIRESFDQATIRQYEKDIKKFEKELVKYINSITYRIDIIDEHIHHLNLE